MTEYAGSDWIERQCLKQGPMSQLGKNVADLLGELFRGIYHLDHKALFRVDWSNESYIEFNLGWHELATTDFDELTRLVFLAHHMAIRVSIEASTVKYLRLTFLQRVRKGDNVYKHPTLDDAVAIFKVDMVHHGIPEYRDPEPDKALIELMELKD